MHVQIGIEFGRQKDKIKKKLRASRDKDEVFQSQNDSQYVRKPKGRDMTTYSHLTWTNTNQSQAYSRTYSKK